MRFSGLKTKAVITVLAAVAGTSAFGYWSYAEYREQALRNAIMELVTDTSVRLGEALDARMPQKSVKNPQSLRKFYEHAEAVDGHYQRLSSLNIAPIGEHAGFDRKLAQLMGLRSLDIAPIGELADAADDYVLTSREILLRRASSQRIRLKLSGSIEALRNHMRADNRTGAWVSEAIRAKERVEEDYRDYRLTVGALARLLESFPASQAKMVAHVDAALLADLALVEEAREEALRASRQAAEEIAKVRQLTAYR